MDDLSLTIFQYPHVIKPHETKCKSKIYSLELQVECKEQLVIYTMVKQGKEFCLSAIVKTPYG
jgi:hypothetical protein